MSLSATLNSAVQSLFVADAALQTTNNNIANANTPGYSREIVDLQSAVPDSTGAGMGVVLQGYTSVRDELVQTQIQQQTQSNSSANAQLSALQQVQTVFTTSSTDIGTDMSSLFTAISSLSTNPSDSSLRQSVLTAGQNLANSFNSASSSLTNTQTSLNGQIGQDVSQINDLASQIAALNPQINALKANDQDGGTLQDQQNELVQQLSKLTDVTQTQTESGITLTTGNGTPLVVGNQSFSLQSTNGTDGTQHVLDANGNDITSTITGGDLGGTLTTRDQTIPGFMNQLDTLANQFANAFNAAQAQGTTQNGTTGTNFFTVPSTVAGSAGSISMAITDPTDLAASSDGSAGSNGNVANFTAVQTTKLPSGSTPTDSYASLVYQVGSTVSNVTAEANSTSSSLEQLNDQLSSVSGVSIDEESTNLLKYQQAYQAAARVITTINALYSVTMSMGTSAAE